MKGLIFNIQKYSLHDGPGIRTTVFFKGCPLNCQWCHNPESIRTDSEKTYNKKKCIKCNSCDDFSNALPCPTNALEDVGKYYTAEDLLKEIEMDIIFFEKSNGGVTFSGGEPLLQSEFLLRILKLCKESGIHTAVDTTGFSIWENIEPILEYVDLFLYDIKVLDSDKHKKFTGVDNSLIIENFKKISKSNEIYIRVPIISGFNDDDFNIMGTCELAKKFHVKHINFLPYHNYSENKYKNLIIPTGFKEFEKPSDGRINHIIDLCTSYGVEAYIGG